MGGMLGVGGHSGPCIGRKMKRQWIPDDGRSPCARPPRLCSQCMQRGLQVSGHGMFQVVLSVPCTRPARGLLLNVEGTWAGDALQQ